MIILISGATHTGKTKFAQQLLEQHKYPYLSIDHLKMGLIRSGNTPLTVEDDDALTKYLWPIVREMIKTAIENNQNLIVEGCYIPFDWKKDFDEHYLAHIKYICLILSDQYINNHFEDIRKHASDIETRLYDADCTTDMLIRENRMYYEGCIQNDCPYILVDKDYEQTMRCNSFGLTAK